MMKTWITLGIIVMIILGAIIRTIRVRRKGVKCIGCPISHACSQSSCSDTKV